MLAKTKTGQTTTQTVIFKPANDSLEKFIPRTKLLGEDNLKFLFVGMIKKKTAINPIWPLLARL